MSSVSLSTLEEHQEHEWHLETAKTGMFGLLIVCKDVFYCVVAAHHVCVCSRATQLYTFVLMCKNIMSH